MIKLKEDFSVRYRVADWTLTASALPLHPAALVRRIGKNSKSVDKSLLQHPFYPQSTYYTTTTEGTSRDEAKRKLRATGPLRRVLGLSRSRLHVAACTIGCSSGA